MPTFFYGPKLDKEEEEMVKAITEAASKATDFGTGLYHLSAGSRTGMSVWAENYCQRINKVIKRYVFSGVPLSYFINVVPAGSK